VLCSLLSFHLSFILLCDGLIVSLRPCIFPYSTAALLLQHPSTQLHLSDDELQWCLLGALLWDSRLGSGRDRKGHSCVLVTEILRGQVKLPTRESEMVGLALSCVDALIAAASEATLSRPVVGSILRTAKDVCHCVVAPSCCTYGYSVVAVMACCIRSRWVGPWTSCVRPVVRFCVGTETV